MIKTETTFGGFGRTLSNTLEVRMTPEGAVYRSAYTTRLVTLLRFQ